MTENIDKSNTIEKYLEDTIVEYLRSQKDVPEYYDFEKINQLEQIAAEEKQKTLFIVEELLNDILHDVDRTIIYQKEYQKAQKEHHQYGLFDLADFLPEFYIDSKIIKQLCFRESLLISDVDQPSASKNKEVKPLAVGGMCLKIELAQGLETIRQNVPAKEMERNIKERIKQLKKELAQQSPDDNESDEEKLKKYEEFLQEETAKAPLKLLVHLSSEFSHLEQNAGSRIVSWVDKDFHTLEERRTEFIFTDEKDSLRQTLYYALQENKYFVKHTTANEETLEERWYCPINKTKDMVGEGANFILMRYLAITRYKGTFELSTFYINGSLCRNIYDCKRPRPGFVNGHPVELCKIYRTIIEECGIIHLSVTVMTVYGMIVSQEWEGCPYIIHVNPDFVTTGKPVPYDLIELKKVWETNIEFVSKYLECKTEAELKMKTYQKDHPEIKEMISDYLQSILLLKPENIMPFTIDYFMSYEPYKLPELPYFDGDEDADREQSDLHLQWG